MKRLLGGEGSQALERALLDVARDIWQVEELARGAHYPPFEHPFARDAGERERRVTESFRRLGERWTEDELNRLVAGMFFNAQPWWDRYVWDHRRPEATRRVIPAQGRIIQYLLQRWLSAHPSDELVALLRARVEHLFGRPNEGPPVPAGSSYPYPPTMCQCLELVELQQGDAATALAYDLVRGTFYSERGGSANTYQPHLSDLDHAANHLLRRVWRAGLLTEVLLEGVFRRQPVTLARATAAAGRAPGGNHNYLLGEMEPALVTEITTHADRLVRRWAENLSEDNAYLLSQVSQLTGSWFLLQACRYIDHLGLKKLPANDYSHRGEIAAAITRLCGVEREPQEDDAKVLAALQAHRESTLLLVLPASPRYQDLICRALGWDGAYELVRLLHSIAHFDDTQNALDRDVRPSADPTNGVFDAREVRALQTRLGAKRFATLIQALANFPAGTKNAAYLVEACLGSNQDKVVASFGKRSQLAVRALGLLPIAHPDESVRRYLALRQFAKEAGKFGLQRQTNERAAAQAGLANLALNAGYADATRLEWAMEDRLGAELGAGGREWQIEPSWTVRLEVGASGPDLTAYREGKPLRTLPEAVKKHAEYGVMKEAKAELRAQARRYRAALEGAMCRGEYLAPGEIEVLARHPAAARMLAALLVADTGGHVGLCHAPDMQLEGVEGHRQPLEGPVRLAHPIDLHARDLLGPWQREVVRRRLVQPFKQAFREIYVLTPAELETRIFSRRFAGQTVDSARAARLLTAEGWECAGEDYPRKLFPAAGLVARLTFVESYHFISETQTLVVDEVCFVPPGAPGWWSDHDDPRLPLAEVPPLLFSEVMRDVDLIVSVAQGAQEPAAVRTPDGLGSAPVAPLPSAEVIERRGDLVRELAADLGYKNVAVEGQYARVQGKLASYRVHMASATIHIEPGAYLCIVPDRWGQRHDKLFLPFDAEDLKTSEVVSKVLLLAEDDKIKDESILAQIRSRTGQ